MFVEYTSLPAARFPVQLDQCYAVLKWVAPHAAEIGADGIRSDPEPQAAIQQMSAAIETHLRP